MNPLNEGGPAITFKEALRYVTAENRIFFARDLYF